MIKNWQMHPLLFRVIKVGGILFAALFLLFAIVSWIVVEKKNEWLLSQIQSYM
jgi:hypothetical protein